MSGVAFSARKSTFGQCITVHRGERAIYTHGCGVSLLYAVQITCLLMQGHGREHRDPQPAPRECECIHLRQLHRKVSRRNVCSTALEDEGSWLLGVHRAAEAVLFSQHCKGGTRAVCTALD